MQSILDMSIATMVCENTHTSVCRETPDRSKAVLGSGGEGEPQRFSDVLPLAQAALEQSPEKDPLAHDTAQAASDDVETAEDASGQSQGKEETGSASPDDLGWPFAAMAQLQAQVNAVAVQSPETVVEGQAIASVESGAASAEQTTATIPPIQQASASEVVATPTGTPVQSQVPVEKGLVFASSDKEVTTGTTVPAEPQVKSAAGKAVPSVSGPAQETSLPASVGSEQTPSARQTAQEPATVDAPQAAPRAMQSQTPDVQADAKGGRAQNPSVSQAVDPAVQAEGGETTVVSKPSPGSQPTIVAETAGQASEKLQPATGQTSAGVETPTRSEKNAQRQSLYQNVQQADASKHPEAASSESKTIEPLQLAGKGVSVSRVKDSAMPSQHQSFASSVESVASSQRPVAQAQTQPQISAGPSAARAPVQSIGDQILDSIQASTVRGDKQVLVRLNPPELGTVLVRFQEQGGRLTGTLEVSSSEARREIEQALPQVARTLQEAGVQVRRLDVVASDQPERDLNRDHTSQDAWSQHQGAGQGREQPYASGQTRWSQNRMGQSVTHRAAPESQSQTTTAQGRIDLLL